MSKRRAKSTTPGNPVRFDAKVALALLVNSEMSLAGRLEAGESLIANGYEAELKQAHPLSLKQEMSISPADAARADRLRAYAAAHAGDLITAEQAIEQATSNYPEALDLIYLSTFIAVSFHEHARTVQLVESFRKIFGNGQVTAPQIPHAYLSHSHLSQTANMAGVAHRALGNTNSAETEFRVAIELDPTQYLAWLNLLHLLSSLNRTEEVSSVVAAARRACPDVPEFAQYLGSAPGGASVSVCMIVKNEEELLPGALASIQQFASQIVIVDTGSTDRTKEIARSTGATIIDEPWEGNFSKHRNTSISHATGDWIFILDADERLEAEDVTALQHTVATTDHRVISINVFNLYGKKKESHNFLPSIRLFRRDLGLRYDGIVHNVLKVPSGERVLRADTRLWHLGYDLNPEKMKQKFERSKTLLEKQLTEDSNNAFAHFNYAQLLRGAELEQQKERADQIIHSASRAVELTGPETEKARHVHLMSLNQLAWAYFAIDETKKAHQYVDRALSHKPNYLDPLMLRGHLYNKSEQFEKAITAYEKYMQVQSAYRPETETDDIIVANVANRAAALYGIALAHHALGRKNDAKRFYRETLRMNDEYHEANQFLGLLELEAGNEAEAIRLLEAQQRTEQPTVHSAIALANIERDRKSLSRALQYAMQGIELDPRNEAAVLLLTELLVQTQRTLELPALYERAIDHGISRQRLQAAEGRGYYLIGEYSRAADLLKEIPNSLTDPSDQIKLAESYFRIGKYDHAAEAYQQALTAGYTDPTIHRNYGVALAKAGRLHQAATTLRAYLGQPDADMGMWETVGDLYLKLKEYSLAIEGFEQFLNHKGTSKTALFGLSTAYEGLGQFASARLGFQQLANQYPNDRTIASRLATVSERCAVSEQVH